LNGLNDWAHGGPFGEFTEQSVEQGRDGLAATIDTVTAQGGTLVQPIGSDAPEVTARFRDPGGNVIGLYQEPGR